MECDIKNIKERVEIRSKIEQGKIEDAISLVNDFNPEVMENLIKILDIGNEYRFKFYIKNTTDA